MAVTLETIINTARDRHSAFDPRRTPDAACARAVTSYLRDLLPKALLRNRRALLTSQVVPLPLADFGAGIALPANVYVGDGAALTKDSYEYPLEVIDRSMIYSPMPFPAAWVEGTRLMLAGTPDDWQDFESVTINYVPAVTPLTKLSDTITLPDEAEPAITERLVSFFYSRGHNDPGLPPVTVASAGMAIKMAQQAEDAFLDSLGARRVGQVFQVQDGF